MARLTRLSTDQPSAETRAEFEAFLKERGKVPNMFRTAAHRPEIMRTMTAHFRAVMNTGTVGAHIMINPPRPPTRRRNSLIWRATVSGLPANICPCATSVSARKSVGAREPVPRQATGARSGGT